MKGPGSRQGCVRVYHTITIAIRMPLQRSIWIHRDRASEFPLPNGLCRYGEVDSVRMRSIPVKLDAAMPRRAAVLTGKIDSQRTTAHAYVVFSQPHEAIAALAHNMQLVNLSSANTRLQLNAHPSMGLEASSIANIETRRPYLSIACLCGLVGSDQCRQSCP